MSKNVSRPNKPNSAQAKRQDDSQLLRNMEWKALDQWVKTVQSLTLSVCDWSVGWAWWVKKNFTCSLTEQEVIPNALPHYARVKASGKLAEAKSILLWLSWWEQAGSQPDVKDGFASLICSASVAGLDQEQFTSCSAVPALLQALSCSSCSPNPPSTIPWARSVAPKENAISFSFSCCFCHLFDVQHWGEGRGANSFLAAGSQPSREAQQ